MVSLEEKSIACDFTCATYGNLVTLLMTGVSLYTLIIVPSVRFNMATADFVSDESVMSTAALSYFKFLNLT